MTVFSAKNDYSGVSADFEFLVVNARLSRYDDPIFLLRISNYRSIFRTSHSIVTDVFDIQRRRTIP